MFLESLSDGGDSILSKLAPRLLFHLLHHPPRFRLWVRSLCIEGSDSELSMCVATIFGHEFLQSRVLRLRIDLGNEVLFVAYPLTSIDT